MIPFWLLPLWACGPKVPPPPPEPDHGWVELAKGACYEAPDFTVLDPGGELDDPRRETLDQLALQWRGGLNDGVDFGLDLARQIRDLLRERPERVEEVAATNLEYCREWAAEGVSTMAWGGWLESLTTALTEGECIAALTEDWFDILSVDRAWQHEVSLCPGETVDIEATASSTFQLGAEGPVTTLAGLADQPVPAEAPCSAEDCRWGELLTRFEALDGSVTVVPVGTATRFVAPAEGVLSFQVNDDTLRDNAWSIIDGVTDGGTVGVRPVR